MVGQGARLTRLLLVAVAAATGPTLAERLPWIVDASCRDGQPHGPYELRSDGGGLRVAGAFNHGRRTSSFIFWSSTGARVAHIPYDDDVRNGTLASWYEPARSGVEPARRFESAWRHGAREGITRSWYADGRRRAEVEYADGRRVAVVGWSDTGQRLTASAAEALAERDERTADATYEGLEALVREHLPNCG